LFFLNFQQTSNRDSSKWGMRYHFDEVIGRKMGISHRHGQALMA
jgi:hypothetical protein